MSKEKNFHIKKRVINFPLGTIITYNFLFQDETNEIYDWELLLIVIDSIKWYLLPFLH